jgi:ProP effector
LRKYFRKPFFIYGARRKPLKLGIRDEIVARLDGAVEPPELALALCLHCRSIGYLRAMRPGAARIDLDGNPAKLWVRMVAKPLAKTSIAATASTNFGIGLLSQNRSH